MKWYMYSRMTSLQPHDFTPSATSSIFKAGAPVCYFAQLNSVKIKVITLCLKHLRNMFSSIVLLSSRNQPVPLEVALVIC